MNRVLVVGSVNMDLVAEAGRFPAPGETVLGGRFASFPGGKGANQAVAARRLGARVALLGCVGEDAFGSVLRNRLEEAGVELGHVRVVPGVSTGVAAITVSRAENAIVVVPGANDCLGPADIEAADAAFAAADVVLCQLEIPLAAVEAAAARAALHGKPFLLNPAPACVLLAALCACVTLLTPNVHELSVLAGEPVASWREVLCRYPGRMMMTCGADGVWFADADGVLRHQPAFPVQAVDTTGAGDTFNGALAAFWGVEFSMLARRACAAAALSVTRRGAQEGMPDLAALEAFLAAQANVQAAAV